MKTQIVDSGDPSEFLFQVFFPSENALEAGVVLMCAQLLMAIACGLSVLMCVCLCVLDLPELLHAAAVCAMTAGSQSEQGGLALGHPLLSALASSLVSHGLC